MNDIKMDAFTPNTINTPEPNLPPAGAARRDELARRADALAEKAETQYADRGSIPADSPVLDPDQNREIQHDIRRGYLEVGVDHPYLKTKWVNYVNQNSEKVWQAKSDGWKVATTEDFPEAKDLLRADNTIRVGDVILMCIRIDEYLRLEQREKNKRLRQQYGVEAEIHDLASSTNRAKGQTIFAGVSTPELGESGNLSDTARRQMAQKAALNTIGNKMKQGPIPGVPIK